MAPSTHHLLATVQQPRLVAYLLALVILASPLLLSLGAGSGLTTAVDGYTLLPLMLAVFIFPFCANAAIKRWLNHRQGVRAGMSIDGLMVGCMLGMVGFEPVPSLALTMMLLVSTAMIAPFRWLLPILLAIPVTALLTRLLCFDDMGRFEVASHESEAYSSMVTDIASLLMSGIWCSYISQLSFRQGLVTADQKRSSATRVKSLEALGEQLQTYLAKGISTRGVSIERKCLTVFFSDIAGFTQMMEETDEQKAAKLLNRYFDAMADIAEQHGGTVDKFIGDGMMVFFGDPQTRGPAEDARQCIKMAEAMRQEASALGQAEGVNIRLRIGINTGHCLVGGFGSEKRRDYTAFGSVVNIASRIEGIAAPGQILLARSTAQLVKTRVPLRLLGQRQLRGIRRPVQVHIVD